MSMLVSYGALPPGATLMLTTGPLLTLLDVQKSLLWTRNPLGLSSEQDPLGVVPPSFHSHVKTADRAEGVGVARTCSGEWTIPLLLPALPTSHGEQTAMGLECGRSATTHRIDCERTEHPTSLQAVEERRTSWPRSLRSSKRCVSTLPPLPPPRLPPPWMLMFIWWTVLT